MSIGERLRGAWSALTGKIPVKGGNSDPVRYRIRSIDTMHLPPSQASIPKSWSMTPFGPGQPFAMSYPSNFDSARRQDAISEPRSFDYNPGINATISPRVAYGLMSFSELRDIAESVPEVAMCIRIITEEIKSFEPRILDPDGGECKDEALRWMYTTPDRFNAWPVWVSRFLYNVLAYDAGAIHRPYNKQGKIDVMRVIDGSTIFVLIDETGEQPSPPAPAFIQIIQGMPREYLNTRQLWYHPRHLRADAPYGRSPIEDALPAVRLLQQLWDYNYKWYTEGNMPEQAFSGPPNWTQDQLFDFEDAYNARMAGNNAERAGRARFLPAGVAAITTKDVEFRKEVLDWASNAVRMAFGIPITEVGQVPGTGLGGSGFLESMQSLFYRLGLAPIKAYLESVFNETLQINGYHGYRFDLAFPKESLDPAKEEAKVTARFMQGIVTRDETRESLGLKAIGGEEGAFMISPGQGGSMEGALPGFGDMIPVKGNTIPVKDTIPVAGARIPVRGGTAPEEDEEGEQGETIPVSKSLRKANGLDPDDDAYFGAQPVIDPHYEQPGRVLISIGKLQPREAFWDEAGDPAQEAVYHIDRTLAPDDQHYLIPLRYQSEMDGKPGTVTVPAWTGAEKPVDAYGEDWIEQGAVLDYITGAERTSPSYAEHMDDTARPVLMTGIPLFGDATRSDFVRSYSGRELSRAVLQSLQSLVNDRALWRDVTDIVGTEKAQAARQRAMEIFHAGCMPVITESLPESA